MALGNLVVTLLFCHSAWAENSFQLADADADSAPHFMSLEPVRAGLTNVTGIHRMRPAAPAPTVAPTAVMDTSPPLLKGFMKLDHRALVPVAIPRRPVNPSTASISSSLAASTTPTASNTPPGANPHASSPALQLFGLEDAPSNNFYKALGGSAPKAK